MPPAQRLSRCCPLTIRMQSRYNLAELVLVRHLYYVWLQSHGDLGRPLTATRRSLGVSLSPSYEPGRVCSCATCALRCFPPIPRIGVGRVLAHYFSITRPMGPARGFTLFYRFPMILSLRYVRIRLLSFHFVWTLGVFENRLRAFSDCVSVCISAPTITGPVVLCLEDL